MPVRQRRTIEFRYPDYVRRRGLEVHPMTRLSRETGQAIPPIQGIGGVMVSLAGFVIVNVQVPCVKGYNEDQIAVVLDDPGMERCPVILGTPTLYCCVAPLSYSSRSSV